MIRSLRRSMFYSFLVVAIAAAGLAVSTSVASAAPTTCGGVVFHDFDADGMRSEDYSFVSTEYAAVDDDGVPGIVVLVTAANGTTIGATTDSNGAWSVALDTNDFPIRVDFSGLPTGWNPTPNGTDSASLNQFIPSAGDCGSGAVGNAGIAAPGTFCENRPELVTSCFLFGNIAGHDDMAAVVSLIDGASDNGGTSGTGWQDDPYTVRATLGQVGTVYGMDSTPDGAVYVGSFVKRHAQLGPTNNPTTIYRVVGTTPAPWFTTDPAAVDPHSGDSDGWLNDYAAFDDVGRQGLGDVEISPDNRTLYTVDLGQKQLVAIPINADGSANTGGVVRTNINASTLGVSSCADSDIRPFALGWSADDQLLVGATCSGESSIAPGDGPIDEVNGPHLGDKSQLASWVFSFDGSFTKIMDVPLPTTSRGTQNGTTNTASSNYFRGQSDWRPWVTQAPFAADMTGWPAGGVAYAQPLMADIEPDGDDFIIGFMDIWAHQVGSNSTYQRDGVSYAIDQPISSGDTLRAVSSGAAWTFPTNGTDFFYDEDNYGGSHSETTLGSAVQIPGRPYAITNSFDPINGSNTWQSGGLEWHANEDFGAIAAGDHVTGYRLYDGRAGLATGTFEKAAGIGDVQALCGVADIEVGNRVWFDVDADGIADPDEFAMTGVEIELLDNAGTVISSTTTDTSGLYTFNSGSIAAFVVGADYTVRIAQNNYDPGGPYATGGVYENQGFPTFANVGSDDGNDNDAVLIAGLPTITFTADSSDHTLDFGMIEPTLRLGNTVWLDADNDGVQNGAETGIAGVEVQLWSVDGAGNPVAIIASDSTGAAGEYNFEDLYPGDYIVAVPDTEQAVGQPLEGLGSTSGNGIAPDPDDDVDLDDNGDPAAGFASISSPVTLRPASEPTGEVDEAGWVDDESNYTVDLGFTTRYRLGNIVWFDEDNDGLADAGEPPIAGVEVQLWTADAAGAPVAQVASTTTDLDGLYGFADLEPSNYVVAIADTQQNTGQALDGIVSSTGNDPASDPDDGVNNDDDGTASAGFAAISAAVSLDGATPITETNGLTGSTEEDGSWADAASDLTIDFGFTGPLRIGSTVFLDEDGNGSQTGAEPGIAGVGIDLWSTDAGGNPVAVVASDTTDVSGTYQFGNLRPGDYIVAIADTEQTVGRPLVGLGSTSGNGSAPDPDDNIDLDDNGDAVAGFATISAPVTLTAGTEPTGEVLEGGWIDADSNLTVDFGFVEGLRLGNLVFEDLDDDGIADSGEPGIAGVTVQLWSVDAGGNPLAELTSTTTDLDGHYSFEGLTPDRYIVAVSVTEQGGGGPLENLISADGNGVAPGPDNNADNDDNGDPTTGFASISSAVTLSSNVEPLGETLRSDDGGLDETPGVDDNDSNLTVDLGFERRYRLGNTVWLDTNNNGGQDAGEAGVTGVEMQLWSVDGAGNPDTLLDTTTTAADGRYSFEGLPAADYVVAIADTEQGTGQALDGLTSSDGNGVAPDPDDNRDLDDNGDATAGFASIAAPVSLGGAEPTGEVGEDPSWTDISSNYTVDFGFVGALRLGSTVFLDVNGNGLDGAIDTPLPAVEVQLWIADGAGNPIAQIATDTTDGSGEYTFDYLAPGDYIVAIADTEQAAGQGLEGLGSTSGNGVAPDPDDGVDLDDNGDPAPGFASISRPVTLTSGSEPTSEGNEGGWIDVDSNLTVDFGFVRSYRLGNTVFFDADNSGSQDVGEPGVSGVEVQLWSVDGAENPIALLATETTDGSGEYLFENLDPATYVIAISDTQQGAAQALADLTSSTGNGTAPDPDDGLDLDDNGDPAPGFASISRPVTLAGSEPTGEAGEGGWVDVDSNLTVDFGFVRSYRLGNTVFFDADNSGSQDVGEPGISGVEVQLWTADSAGNPVAQITTDTTDASGIYLFENIDAGEYIVAIADTQSGAGLPLEDLLSSDGNGIAPDPDDDRDDDDNGDPSAGFASITQALTLGGNEPTGETGEGGWPDASSNLTVDFGFRGQLRLGSTVFIDEDGNGSQDVGEPGVLGAEVQLWSVDDIDGPETLIGSTTTDASGYYEFDYLVGREYIVAVPDTEQGVGEALVGLTSTSGNGVAPDPDDDVDLDDNGDAAPGFASISQPVVVTVGAEPTGEGNEAGWVDDDSNLTVDFGFVRSYRLGNNVWLDDDNNGLRGAGEAGILGVEVQLWSVDAGGNLATQLATDTTDASGEYLFENLEPGAYIVAVSDIEQLAGQPLADLVSSTGNGTPTDPDDDVDLDDDGDPVAGYASIAAVVTLGGVEPIGEVDEGGWIDSESNLTVDFGFVRLYRLGDVVFLDSDNSGSQDAGEAGILGVEVQLWSADGAGNPVAQVATDTTDAAGAYLFADLDAGEYIVAVSDTETAAGSALEGLVSSTGNGVAPDPDDGVDLDDNGDPSTGFASITQAVTIVSGGPTGEATEDGSWADSLSNLTVDFGFTGPMRLGSTVFLDADGDGSQGAGEPGIGGVEVQLWSVDDTDGPETLIATTSTGVDGFYVFENLVPADYIVAVPDTEQGVGQELDGLGSTAGNGVAPDPDDDLDLDDNGDPFAGFASISQPVTLTLGAEATGETNESGWVDADSNLTVDFGFIEGLRLGNLVFEDLDDDRVADAGEPGIAGVEMQLWSADAAGAPVAQVASTFTDGDGHYAFEGLTPGAYVLAIPASDQATGEVLENLVSADGNGAATDPDDNADNDDDGDAGPGFASISAAVILTSNIEPTGETLRSDDGTLDENGVVADDDSNLTVDFGFERRYRVGNLVWFDANNNGIADNGELPLSGVEAQLWTADAAGVPQTFLAAERTDAAGHYLFENLERGDYIVAILDTEQNVGNPLEGYIESTGIDPATDPDDGVDNDDDGALQAGFASISQPFTLGDPALIPTGESNGLTGAPDEDGSWRDDSSNLTVDFGFIGSLRLGSTVWLDQDGNGVQNSTEPAITGVEVQLWSADAAGDPVAQVATTTTDASGNYEFVNLLSGEYIVAIADTQQAAGMPLEGLGSTMGNGAAPDPDDDIDLDDNGDASPGFASISAPVSLDAGTEPSLEAHEGAWVDADSNFSVDFGFAPGLELGNVVFVDDDNNGVQDAGEPQIPGVTLELVSNTGVVLATTITDSAGIYVFSNIAPGTYSVRIPSSEFEVGAPLAGWHTSTGAGVSADADDDVDANSDRSSGLDVGSAGVVSGPVTLVSGAEPTGEPEASPGGLADPDSNLTVDFGFYQLSLGNYVWFDDDNDGIFDPSELPAGGVILELLDEDGDPVLGPDGEPMVATTDSNGEYSFDGLPEGTFVVGIPAENFVEGAVLHNVVTSTGNNNGVGSAPDPDDDVEDDDNGNFVFGGGATSQPIVLAAGLEPGGNVNTTVDFGFTPAAGVGSLVWLDNDRDGVQDPGERGVPDVVVTVIHVPSGQVYGTDTTDSTGNWSVTGIPPGDYTVVFDDPLNRTYTSIDRGDDALDSDTTPNGETGIVNLSAGEYDPTVDAGILPPPPTITQIALTGSTLTAALLAWGIGAAFIGWAMVLMGREPEENPYLNPPAGA